MRFLFKNIALIGLLIHSNLIFAQDPSPTPAGSEYLSDSTSPFALVNRPEKRRSYLLPPLFSLILPGFDQYVENQFTYGIFYSAYAVAGLALLSHSSRSSNFKSTTGDNFNDLSSSEKAAIIGSIMYQDIGMMSAYHSFRTAVRSRPDDFSFLNHEETPGQLALSPFKFSYMLRPTTFLFLALPVGLLAHYSVDDQSHWRGLKGSDAWFIPGVSFHAGVGEEAAFRGWLMPTFKTWFGSNFWSNTGVATLFAAAHISKDNRIPWPQFVIGFYFGWMVQNDEWQLGEAIFNHFWWDVLVIAAEIGFDKGVVEGKVYELPLFQIPF